MNPTSIPNLSIPPYAIPSSRYTQHSTNPSAFSNHPPHYQISSPPRENQLYSAQAPTATTNINDLPHPDIPDWSLFDASILSMGETTGGLDQGLMDPSSVATGASGGGFSDLSERGDGFQTLFHNSFGIWGALENQREGAEGYVV